MSGYICRERSRLAATSIYSSVYDMTWQRYMLPHMRDGVSVSPDLTTVIGTRMGVCLCGVLLCSQVHVWVPGAYPFVCSSGLRSISLCSEVLLRVGLRMRWCSAISIALFKYV